ncbi:MAG TPA: class I SAM-dependent methyltransferase [Candidatus Acidoferrum sp.]|nr:class I SAM-dependent methyltransferase [Candidatus Acidoferrum sp.]
MLLESAARLGCRSGRLLDIGCFSGMFLANAMKRGFEVAGVEPNRDAFLHVRKELGCEVVHGGLCSASFPDDGFSAVSYLDVIEHVPDPVTELKEAFRVMRSGAVLILTTPNAAGLPQRVLRVKRRLSGAQIPCPIDDVPWHLWGFTRDCLARCVQRCGFKVARSMWLKPSALTTNLGAGSSLEKRVGLRLAANVSEWLQMSDRMALFAQKP